MNASATYGPSPLDQTCFMVPAAVVYAIVATAVVLADRVYAATWERLSGL